MISEEEATKRFGRPDPDVPFIWHVKPDNKQKIKVFYEFQTLMQRKEKDEISLELKNRVMARRWLLRLLEEGYQELPSIDKVVLGLQNGLKFQ